MPEMISARFGEGAIYIGDTAAVEVQNNRETPLRIQVALSSEDPRLSFTPPDPQSLLIGPGSSGTAYFQVRSSENPLLGSSRHLPFLVTLSSEADTTELPAAAIQQPLVPVWALIALLALGLAFVCSLFFVQNRREAQIQLAAQATMTGFAGLTATVDANLAADPDSDGLSNQTEEGIGTDPLNPDTDGDLLTDGDEIINRGTDPLVADTDGDGLNDG
ncbi:MAG TPA: hypothetical protein VJ768_02250, partial [Anaerolineales bacterium]|nr:hypothetical protein [Anaerolineales bacterium]